jgi:hypothetical protein
MSGPFSGWTRTQLLRPHESVEVDEDVLSARLVPTRINLMTADIVPILFYTPESVAMELEDDMDGQVAVQGVILLRAAIDAARSLLARLPSRHLPDEIPVHRLVSRNDLILARSSFATDITEMRWPQ